MNWDMFSFQELCTDPCDMGPYTIMLKREVMAADEGHDTGPQDLVTISLCIQIAMQFVFVVRSLCLPIPQPHCHHGALSSQR